MNFISQNKQYYFLFLIMFGLSISILFKELNILFFSSIEINSLIIFRLLVIIFSLLLLFNGKRIINYQIILISVLNLIFLINIFFENELIFNVNVFEYFRNYNIYADERLPFFQDKNKIILINLFNIVLPLLILSFVKINIDISVFINQSYKLCKIFITILSPLILFKFINYHFFTEIKNGYEGTFVNLHSLIYFLNIFFIILILKKYKYKNISNKEFIFLSGVIFFNFLLSTATINFMVCFGVFYIYIFFSQIAKKKILISIIILILIISSLVLYDIFFQLYLNQQNITEPFIHHEFYSGSMKQSVIFRFSIINLFLTEVKEFNYFFGNTIFINNIFTYPHNFILDIYICSGFLGLILFFIVLIKFLIKLRININQSNILFLLIFFQSIFFSSLSGFFFTNIILNISFAICLNLSKENDENIKYIS